MLICQRPFSSYRTGNRSPLYQCDSLSPDKFDRFCFLWAFSALIGLVFALTAFFALFLPSDPFFYRAEFVLKSAVQDCTFHRIFNDLLWNIFKRILRMLRCDVETVSTADRTQYFMFDLMLLETSKLSDDAWALEGLRKMQESLKVIKPSLSESKTQAWHSYSSLLFVYIDFFCLDMFVSDC